MTHVYRIGLLAAILATLVLVGFWQIRSAEERRSLEELRSLNAELQAQLAERTAMVTRLGLSRRVAHVIVQDQDLDPDGRIRTTTIDFIELDDDAGEVARQTFRIPGDVLFVDALTIKFDAEDVAIGHALRGTTLILLRRVYSESMSPRDGFPIDVPGAVPPVYAGSDQSRFERQLWANFWRLAEDPELAAELGVRVAQGEAVYKPVKPGTTYDLVVDAAGGMSLIPIAAATTDG